MDQKLICKRCGHIWTPRTKKKPLVCPKCKSYSWETSGKRK